MKKIIKLFVLLILLVFTFKYRNEISTFILEKYVYRNADVTLNYNNYYNSNNYIYVQNVDNYNVASYQDLLNTLYTIINSGENDFVFSCDKEYERCLKDVENIASDAEKLSSINNFVNPYNSFKTVSIDINNTKRIRIKIEHLYNEEEIKYINNFITTFKNSNINENMSIYDKIKIFHDYIINSTVYDSETAKNINNNLSANNTAYSLLKEHKSICSGYSDIMSIYLNSIGINNIKVSSKNHVWNLLYIDNKWKHIDLTWDDPITSNNTQTLLHDYFIIDTAKLYELDQKEHNFDISIYKEAN